MGPSLVALSLTEMFNTEIWASNTAAGVYLNGCILFVSGLAIVQNHNIWRLQWTALITIFGWGSLALGLMRMIAPEKIRQQAARMSREQLRFIPGLLLPFGIWMTVKGFF